MTILRQQILDELASKPLAAAVEIKIDAEIRNKFNGGNSFEIRLSDLMQSVGAAQHEEILIAQIRAQYSDWNIEIREKSDNFGPSWNMIVFS